MSYLLLDCTYPILGIGWMNFSIEMNNRPTSDRADYMNNNQDVIKANSHEK